MSEKRSVIVWLSPEANKIITAELEEVNKGSSNRRGDWVLTKAQRCSQIIDEYCKIVNSEEDK